MLPGFAHASSAVGGGGTPDGPPSTSTSTAAAALFNPAWEFRTVNMRKAMAISFQRITGQDVDNAVPITNAIEQVR
ncbi:hypothetical protein IU459_35125 [Nocardia amamiensis]|uniref:Uncharacterized protein n=1 Tax=Nocardia amamiensis TaxID=404578 RepID=A0ABS0D6I0_9NOCA|nr:hypothetical protein [Nocardia amamiensis]MBF6302728.1 hypothetical protein [Nocardia amamiensis]